ncbi:MBL fold metallo-hydrolase [Shewanella sp. Isolate7]|nr:MBL fold metallo-hydrolase [Shewanella sp. Isolate7]MCG9720580.1 MBL fold metallo-hydrolase [Shewanella sp. Isolate7]
MMKNLKQRLLTRLLAPTLLLIGLNSQAAPLEVSQFNPGASSIFAVSSSLISGENEVMLIDAQFQNKDALSLVELIKASGKHLSQIYISHSDPDFYFGLATLRQHFPQVKIVSTPATRQAIAASMEGKLAYWGPILKDDAPKALILPEAVTSDTLSLEGEEIIIKGFDGPDAKHTYLWVPSAKTITGGVQVFENMHVWMADSQTQEERQVWRDQLKQMQALNPVKVIPGHYAGEATFDSNAVQATLDYITAFEIAAATAKDAAELAQKLQSLYPGYQPDAVLEISTKVIMGEMRWPM